MNHRVLSITAAKNPSLRVLSGDALKKPPAGGVVCIDSRQTSAQGRIANSGCRFKNASTRSSFSHGRIEQVV